ncbi:MAG: preprotein translocase subunit YajC [Phycisphaerae bacterium]
MKTYAIVAAEPNETPPEGQDQQQPCSWHSLILLGGIFVIFYFLLIRPQQKRRKEEEQRKREMLDSLKKHDHVVTLGGIHGIVVSVGDEEVTIKIDEKADVKMRVARDYISRVVREDEKDGALPEGTKGDALPPGQ